MPQTTPQSQHTPARSPSGAPAGSRPASSQRHSSGSHGFNATPFAILVLAVCMIVSAAMIGSNLTKLANQIQEQKFTTQQPDSLTVTNRIQSDYYTEAEAAEYLRLPGGAETIRAMVQSGQLVGYIRVHEDNSMIFSKEALDKCFKDHAINTPQTSSEGSSSGSSSSSSSSSGT